LSTLGGGTIFLSEIISIPSAYAADYISKSRLSPTNQTLGGGTIFLSEIISTPSAYAADYISKSRLSPTNQTLGGGIISLSSKVHLICSVVHLSGSGRLEALCLGGCKSGY